jgi:hypothetical protein
MKRDVPKAMRSLYARIQAGTASPRQAIKLHCLACCGFERDEVFLCADGWCPLHAYRPQRKVRTTGPEAARRPRNTEGLRRWRESKAAAKANSLGNGPTLGDPGPVGDPVGVDAIPSAQEM